VNDIKSKCSSFFSPQHGTIFSFIGTSLSLVSVILSFHKKIDLSIIILIIAVIILIFAIVILLWKRRILFFKDKSSKYFNIDLILRKLEKKCFDITVAGRTNISWFECIEERKKLYEKAIKKGCRIKFIIQRCDIKNTGIDEVIEKEILEGYKIVTSSFITIYEHLKENKCQNVDEKFKMILTQHPVNNSITYIEGRDGSNIQFSYDIGLNVLKKVRPALVFRKDALLPELLNQLKDLEKNSINLFDYNDKYRNAKYEIDNLSKKYSQFSIQRENHNEKLIHHYYKRKETYEKKQFYPPVSMQLLITNKCTTKCIMCEHSSINAENELTLAEIENVLEYISDLGTKNIIISGGEPFFRQDLLQILEMAVRKNLNIGLLTNGIKHNDESITLDDAQKIKESCAWIQLSIDSFNSETYKKIRGIDIDIVKQSLTNLTERGVNVEIAFTIQKQNIDEAIQIIQKEKNEFNTSKIIRFKFAHGYDCENNFLLSGKETELQKFIRSCKESNNFNTGYISKMFTNNYFNTGDIIKGVPLSSLNNVFKDKRYTCHVMNYSCKIDAKGNVYPCCFLYDDNKGDNSSIRERYNLGSLRKNNNQIPSFEKNNNILKEILNKKIPSYKNDIIPINEIACNQCTRHFYQNTFLNEIDKINEKYKEINFIYPYSEIGSDNRMWL